MLDVGYGDLASVLLKYKKSLSSIRNQPRSNNANIFQYLMTLKNITDKEKVVKLCLKGAKYLYNSNTYTKYLQL